MDSDSDLGASDSDTVEIRSRSEKAQHTHAKHHCNNEYVYITKALMKCAQLYVLTAGAKNNGYFSKDILIESGCYHRMTPYRTWFFESTY
jgi:hypothetical protein